TASHLPEQPKLLGRSSEDNAADRRKIESLGQNHAVADEIGFTRRQPPEDRVPFGLWSRTVHMLGLHARLQKFVLDVDGMSHVDAEHQGFPALRWFVPV